MSSKSIHYCDRCGREIPSNVRPRRRLFWSRTFVKANLAYILSGDEDDLDISETEDEGFDLCAGCNESFIQWFKDGKSRRGEKK